MNELIKVTTNEQGSQVVSARDLYNYLGFDKSQWKRWYEKNILTKHFVIQKVKCIFEVGIEFFHRNGFKVYYLAK